MFGILVFLVVYSVLVVIAGSFVYFINSFSLSFWIMFAITAWLVLRIRKEIRRNQK